MKILFCMMMVLLALALAGCSSGGGGNSGDGNSGGGSEKNRSVTLHFYNESSYKVYIYKNINPASHDPSSVYLTVASGETKTVKDYPSADNAIGDTFYPRYLTLLADNITTGTVDIYAAAEGKLATMKTITFVLEKDKTYTKTVRQPDELEFLSAYMTLYNSGGQTVTVLNGGVILERLDAADAASRYNVLPGQTGYFELAVPYGGDRHTFNGLKVSDGSQYPFASFTAEKGYLYSYGFDGGAVSESAARRSISY